MKSIALIISVVMLTAGCGTTALNMEIRSSVSASGEGLPGKMLGKLAQGTHNAVRERVCGGQVVSERRSARYRVETDNYYNTYGGRHKKRLVPATQERTSVRGELRC